MRKSAAASTALVIASIFGGVMFGSLASSGAAPQNCWTGPTPNPKPTAPSSTWQRTGSDEFGSCETKDGNVKCGRDNATEIGQGGSGATSLGYLIVDQNKGAQACSEDGQGLPISGRITAYKHSGNKVTVAADGGDQKNASFGGASGWDRVDADADNGKVCVWRGNQGTYWTRNNQNHTPIDGTSGNINECRTAG